MDAVVDAKGRCALGGSLEFDGKPHLIIVRLLPDGTFDRTFGESGYLITQEVSSCDMISIVNDRYIVGGRILVDSTSQAFLATISDKGRLIPVN